MNTTVIYPKSKELKKYVQYFLFIDTYDESNEVAFNCYPNTNCSLSINKGNIEIVKDGARYVYDSDRIHSFYVGIYKTPMQYRFYPGCEEISINFQPSGLDSFINESLSEFSLISGFLGTVLGKKLNALKHICFEEKCIYKRALIMEKFLLNVLESKSYFNCLPLNEYHFNSVDEMASHFNMSYRSFHRYFKKTFLVTPIQFLIIKRFRNTLNNLNASTSDKLSDLVFEHEYYDQSHLIKDFKRLTHLAPGDFLKKASVTNGALWWHPAD